MKTKLMRRLGKMGGAGAQNPVMAISRSDDIFVKAV
jgi:hypothetical protein